MRTREKAKLEKDIETLRNPGGGMHLVSHGFEKVETKDDLRARISLLEKVEAAAAHLMRCMTPPKEGEVARATDGLIRALRASATHPQSNDREDGSG